MANQFLPVACDKVFQDQFELSQPQITKMARSLDASGESMKHGKDLVTKDQTDAIETCYFCARGIVEEKHVTVDFRWGDRLTIIENVPAKVCNECGERYYAAKVVRQMEHLAQEGKKEKELSVPVMSWA